MSARSKGEEPKSKGKIQGPEGISSLRWWAPEFEGDRPRAEACIRWLQRVLQRQDLRRRVHLFNAQLYEDIPNLGLGPYQYSVYDMGSNHLRLNLVRAVTDTYVSMITSSKPKPRALTSDGDWVLKKKARGLTRFFEGIADKTDLYASVSNPCCLDSAVFGMGIAKVFRENREQKEHWDVGVERVFPWELIADDAEAQNPKRLRNLAHRKWYDRQVAAEMFPDSADYILHHAPRYGPTFTAFDWAIDSVADLISISELWHLPSYPGATDGRHCIVLEGKTLYDGPWDRSRFPFAMLYRTKPSMGIWGVSIPHELRGAHEHVNQALLDIEDCLHIYAKPKWMYPVGSVDPNFLDDDAETMIPFAGVVPPQRATLQSVLPADLYQNVWTIWQKGFEQIGISQEQSQGKVDEGISGSGASIRAAADVRDGRMFRCSENYQNWHMDIAALMIDEARDIAEEKPDYASAYRGKTYVEIVKFRNVDPGKDAYYLHVYPESRLSKNPAQRLAQLQEMFNAKVIGQDEFRELLEFPDLEGEDNLMNAPREFAEKLITRFLEADDPTDPEVFVYPESDWPLDQLSVRMQYAKIRAQLDDAPEGNVKLLTDFIKLCDVLKAKAAPPAPPPPAVPGGAPALPPGAPPGPPGPAGLPDPSGRMTAPK